MALAGNEIEAMLVRVLRQYELTEPKQALRDLLTAALKDVRTNPNTKKLEYMDLVAVKECTDNQFLPERYRGLAREAIDGRLNELRRYV